MHHATPLITTIVGGLVLAFILGMIANKLRISPLVGYLLAGVLAGPFTPGFVADTKLAPELAELGVILLMFGVGLHFSLKDLMAVKSIAIPGAIAQIAVATLLGMALSAALGWSLMTGIVFGLCLSTASTVVLLRALEERQLIDSQRGQIAIGWLIVEDLVMVLTLVLLPAIAGMAEKGNVGFASLALDLGITIGKVVAFIAIMMLVGRRLVPWIMSRSAATGSRELFTLSVLATLAIIIFGKSAAAFFLVRMFGHSPRTALTIAASLAQIGEFAFILAGLGMALNLLPQAGQNLVLAGAIISIMLNPVLFTLLEKYLDKTETLDEQTLEEVLEDEKQVPVDICNHALLVGFGRVGSLLGEKLMAQGIPLVVVETSRTRVDELRERGISAVLGNAANEEIMELAHLDCARWLLLTIPNGYEAGEIVASAREKCPNIEIIARAHYDDEVDYIIDRGANQVVMGEREIARAMLRLLETPPAGEVVTG
ncbi:Potassium/proton antiporter RosB [Klebsiella pneumoniae]|uniref:Potassium/proton antiporter RosB n=2 Tax=Klebsiella pneumoniae TaxID=573 RepID=A0A377XU17_KLEPN|nr:cation:proton antiporter [Klebsiella pneumoniae]STS61821.1 Potassium/proton antiporter RosB [Klebsiella pneumoniae]STT92049.1 Potassium/proton antiporter RosB [Klebsiella pneumoniae]BBJ81993.1 Kef family K(+) transporter [Klebsiella pneumoniae]HBY9733491.1 cation:proton antiport protein [Klebsiella pneumoniae]HBY9795812.1 cation:proton antiport protein [Klebsiella pneumoniae]